MIQFDSDILLLIAPALAAAVGLLALWARGRRIRRAARWSSELARVAARRGPWSAVLLSGATLAALVALAGPRWGTRVVETQTKGLSLVIAVDISRSMLAEDVMPSRLERAKREARRLIHDLGGDRIGLIAFTGQSFIMSPLTVDGSALHLLVDALDPDLSSTGGSNLSQVLRQGRELLMAKSEVADRVLVIFTDGEAHDSLSQVVTAAERLRRDGIRTVLVAEGGREPANIPVRDLDGRLIGYQRDPDDNVVETRRRDDILSSVADAAEGALVSAEVADQAGAVREMVEAFKRAPEATTTAAQDILRAWIPLMIAVAILLLHAATRPTAALAVLMLGVGLASPATAQEPRNPADQAWRAGRFDDAQRLYAEQARLGDGGDTVLFNAGTAAMAVNDTIDARLFLERAARSLDPAVRFRALFNLGLMDLRSAERDSANLAQHLEQAKQRYREALLIRPEHANAKWNYELAVLHMPPQAPPDPSQGPPAASDQAETAPQQGLSAAQAEQILNSIAEEERTTRDKMNRRRSQSRERRGRRDW